MRDLEDPEGSWGISTSPPLAFLWLRSTINRLGVLTGAQLFSLNKEELKSVCPDDGARVYSQVTVQKAAVEVGPCITPRSHCGV